MKSSATNGKKQTRDFVVKPRGPPIGPEVRSQEQEERFGENVASVNELPVGRPLHVMIEI